MTAAPTRAEDLGRRPPADPDQARGFAVLLNSLQRFATVSDLLRMLGAVTILASMSLFLLQGWSEGNDISRYLMLLAETGLLGAAGFLLSHGFREPKGARIFFGLALVSVPANFAILGALVFSVIQWDGALGSYPAFATWQIQDPVQIGVTLASAALVLAPVAWFCFMIMARRSAKWLTPHFLLLNALLVLPMRGSLSSGLLALAGTIYAVAVIRRLMRRDTALGTGEGRFALATLFIPPAIILGRSFYLYEIESLLVAVVCLSLFLAARQAAQIAGQGTKRAYFLEILSLPIAGVFGLAVADVATGRLLEFAFAGPIFGLGYALLAGDIVQRTASPLLAKMVGASISVLLGLSFLFALMLDVTALSAGLCILGGAGLLGAAVLLRNVLAGLVGLHVLGAGVVLGFDPILTLVLNSSWITLAICGAAAIVAGSLLERHGAAVKLGVDKWLAQRREERLAVADDFQRAA